ncbi:MAG: hypothetical protein IRY99_04945 [Isosphaeraceae bacterium]|nr:hypothetical protein [Isosphaeraceae bacterium]
MRRSSDCLIVAVVGALSCWAAPTTLGGERPDKPTTKTATYKTTEQGHLEIVLHLPPGWKETDRRPAIVFFFGGGWERGRITQFEPQADHLARRGMVAARADYRVKSRHGVTPTAALRTPRARSAGCGPMPPSWAPIRIGSWPPGAPPGRTLLPAPP